MIRANTMDVLLRTGDAGRCQRDNLHLRCYGAVPIGSLLYKRKNSVERAIRHAFETTLIKGDSEILEKYLDVSNAQNSNLLKSLYFRLRHEELKNRDVINCNPESCKMKKQIYQEAMTTFFTELEHAIKKRLESS